MKIFNVLGDLIYEDDSKTMKETVENAVKKGTNLKFADLNWANLSYASLSGANLIYTNLKNANLFDADLTDADLTDADLSCANLFGANLKNADLMCANLSYANLIDTNLNDADLRWANLKNADLKNANLSNAHLNEKDKIRKGTILDKSIIGYKKCCDNIIVKLEIPKGAIVFCINNNKCRTNIAKCLEIYADVKEAKSRRDNNFKYKVGKTYKIKDFNLMYNEECASGIHFFRTKKEAEKY